MILVELKGGMGNMMFQYAAAKSLSLHLDTKLLLDISFFNFDSNKFDLRFFQIQDEIAPTDIVKERQNFSLVKKISQRLLPPHKRLKYREPYFHYDANFFNASNNTYLKGLWQSPLYFAKYQDEIRKIFTIKENYIDNLDSIANDIKNSQSVSVHIRRGDYLSKIAYRELGLTSIEFYKKSIAYMSETITNPQFYFFSDDIEWVKSEFHLPNANFVSGEKTKNNIEDFYLMSQCKHNIIANSTFSWWAAWLNENPEKIVVAPIKWFNKLRHSTKDLIPEKWIRI